MMNRRSRKRIVGAAAAALTALLAVAAWHGLAHPHLPAECAAAGKPPRIRPDYSDTIIPPNIAPLNFLVEEPGTEYRVQIRGAAGTSIVVGSHSPSIVIPPRPWRDLLGENRGSSIAIDIYVKDTDARWRRFDSIKNDVACEPIDSHLVYRLIGPVCALYRRMGIYQRNLETYDQSPIVTNDRVECCINCHTFCRNKPETFSFDVRPGKENGLVEPGMIVVRGDRVFRPKTKTKDLPKPPSYTAWHPDGCTVAFSMNKTRQFFRGVGPDVRDVFDYESDLAAANVVSSAVCTSPDLVNPDRLETFPNWSPDGNTLFFSSAERLGSYGKTFSAEGIREVKYDLMAARYDAQSQTWRRPETILSSSETGKSITEARASPDGRYLLFCMSDYGTFPIQQASSDLYLMELKSRKYRRLECNSEQTDSWHCWSSNSRWIVFSSKRDNGLLARPYFAYIDTEGHAHKPFVLPQKDPAFYDDWPKTFNVPELVSGPVTISQEELDRAISSAGPAADGPQQPPAADSDVYQRSGSR